MRSYRNSYRMQLKCNDIITNKFIYVFDLFKNVTLTCVSRYYSLAECPVPQPC